jgi:hypothetical protein
MRKIVQIFVTFSEKLNFIYKMIIIIGFGRKFLSIHILECFRPETWGEGEYYFDGHNLPPPPFD